MAFDTFDWKSEVINERYHILDPWDPKSCNIFMGTNFNTLLNYKVTDVPNKLNIESFCSFSFAIHVLQHFFIRGMQQSEDFLDTSNMIVFIKCWLHSLKHVNVNFIEKWCEFLSLSIYTGQEKLMRMLGICCAYLDSPELFEAVVPSQSNLSHSSYNYPVVKFQDLLGGEYE